MNFIPAWEFQIVNQSGLQTKELKSCKVVIQNSAIKCFHEFNERSHKDLQVLILAGPFRWLIKGI